MSNRRIMGIDPGTNILGYAVLDQKGDSLTLVCMGVVKMTKLETHQDKLLHIYQSVARMILSHRPEEMAVEAPFYGKNVQSMLKLGRAQGVAIAAALTREIKVVEYSPKKIKLAITGSGNASKEQVASMLTQLVKGNLDSDFLDATDALATAVCHAYQGKLGGSGKKHYSDWKAFAKDHPGRVG